MWEKGLVQSVHMNVARYQEFLAPIVYIVSCKQYRTGRNLSSRILELVDYKNRPEGGCSPTGFKK